MQSESKYKFDLDVLDIVALSCVSVFGHSAAGFEMRDLRSAVVRRFTPLLLPQRPST